MSRKKKKKNINFRAIRETVTMEAVLGRYGLLETMERRGNNLIGCCPIHKGWNRTQFRVNLSENTWHCSSQCKHGGHVVDFISRMENTSNYGAVLKAIRWFKLDPDQVYAEPVNG